MSTRVRTRLIRLIVCAGALACSAAFVGVARAGVPSTCIASVAVLVVGATVDSAAAVVELPAETAWPTWAAAAASELLADWTGAAGACGAATAAGVIRATTPAVAGIAASVAVCVGAGV